MQKTLDAVSKEVIQSVNNYKEADPIKLQITQAQPRPIQQQAQNHSPRTG
jgi:hypothetical protein